MADRDLVIVGGGFGGSILSMIAARIGLRVTLIDKQRHPRFAIGESSTPAGNMILAAIARRYQLSNLEPLARYGTWKTTFPAIGVGPKRGFSYFRHESAEEWRQAPDHGNELLVAASTDPVDCDTHWYRPDVDTFLFKEAGRLAVEVIQGVAVETVDGHQPWRLELDDGQRFTTDLLVDATGAGGFAGSHLGVGVASTLETRTSATFAHVAGLPRWESYADLDSAQHPFPCDAAAVHHVSAEGWMWQLRFDTGRTSVGVVVPGDTAPDIHQWISGFPSLAKQFGGATFLDGPLRTGRLQRRVSAAGGPGWALLPHAAGFVDPLHSTGIASSLAGIERLGRLLEAGTSDFSEYGNSVLAELDHVDRLVAVCYRSLRDFERFVAATMLYFAASIFYERARLEDFLDLDGLFLGADRPELVAVARSALTKAQLPALQFRDWVRRAIETWNDVGLLDPEARNMYRHSAPRAW